MSNFKACRNIKNIFWAAQGLHLNNFAQLLWQLLKIAAHGPGHEVNPTHFQNTHPEYNIMIYIYIYRERERFSQSGNQCSTRDVKWHFSSSGEINYRVFFSIDHFLSIEPQTNLGSGHTH